jgi:hypothetical protein
MRPSNMRRVRAGDLQIDFDGAAGRFVSSAVGRRVREPSFLAVDRSGRALCRERTAAVSGRATGAVSAFAIDSKR